MSNQSDAVNALLSSADFGDRLQGVNQLRSLDPAEAFELIQPVVTDSNVRVRYVAVSQIGSLGRQNKDRALEMLRISLRDSEPDIQAAAADAIAALQLTAAFEDLQQLYRISQEWIVQFSIIAGLGELGDPRGFDLLTEALNSDLEVIQTVAIGALGELGDPRAVTLLEPYAVHADWQIRSRVVQALSNLRTPEAIAILEKLSQDDIPQVAEQAQAVLA